MSPSIVLITGGNHGLGLETVRSLWTSSKSYTILLGTRTMAKGEAAARDIEAGKSGHASTSIITIQIDIQDDTSIEKVYDLVNSEYGRVDTLINNAGAAFDGEAAKGKMTVREAWNKAHDLNTTCTHLFTEKFVPLLLKSQDPRLLFIASGAASLINQASQTLSFDQPPPKGWPKQNLGFAGYRISKTGMNMMMREWARMLTHDGVKVWAVSPGRLATGLGFLGADFMRKNGALEPSIGATLVRDVVEGKRDDEAGKVVDKDGVQPW